MCFLPTWFCDVAKEQVKSKSLLNISHQRLTLCQNSNLLYILATIFALKELFHPWYLKIFTQGA